MYKENKEYFENKGHIKVLLLFILLLYTIDLVFGSNDSISRDLSLEIMVPSNFTLDWNFESNRYVNKYFDKLFKITNLDYKSGITDNIDIFVIYNFTFLEGVYLNFNSKEDSNKNSSYCFNFSYFNENYHYYHSNFTIKGLNSYKLASTGSFNFTKPGFYLLCGEIINASYSDPNLSNNVGCLQINVFSNNSTTSNFSTFAFFCSMDLNESGFLSNLTSNLTINLTANVSINVSINSTSNLSNIFNNSNITLSNDSLTNISSLTNVTSNFNCYSNLSIETEKNLFEDETIVFYIRLNPKPVNFSVEYWIENLFDEEIKSKVKTTNLASKQFTPKINERDMVFLIKCNVYSSCLSNGSLYTEKMVYFKTTKPQELPACPKTSCNELQYQQEIRFTYLDNGTCVLIPQQDGTISQNSKNINKTEILSFYTRSKTNSGEIKFYTRLSSKQGINLYFLNGNLVNKVVNISSGTYNFTVNTSSELTNYLLLLGDENQIIDAKIVTLNNSVALKSKTNQSSSIKNSSIKNSSKLDTLNTSLLSQSDLLNLYVEGNNNSTLIETNKSKILETNTNLITGEAIYQSQSAKSFSIVPYFILGLGVFIISFLIWKKL